MKVIAINGSPRKEGNTWQALNIVGYELKKEGIDFEILDVGHRDIRGCLACGKCGDMKNEHCVIGLDFINDAIKKMKTADGILLGAPVYYSGMGGTMKSFLDRVFYVAGANGGLFRHKVGASIVAVRRTGGSSTFDALNHYITISEMIMVSSNYWNIIHGRAIGDIERDEEGIQTLQQLGRNMAWLLKMRAESKLTPPAAIQKIYTPFGGK